MALHNKRSNGRSEKKKKGFVSSTAEVPTPGMPWFKHLVDLYCFHNSFSSLFAFCRKPGIKLSEGRNSDVALKPEIIFCYVALAVLATVFVNWALTTLLLMLKPFTCAAILLAFVRPDLVQTFTREENLRLLSDKMKVFLVGLFNLLAKAGEQLRSKFN